MRGRNSTLSSCFSFSSLIIRLPRASRTSSNHPLSITGMACSRDRLTQSRIMFMSRYGRYNVTSSCVSLGSSLTKVQAPAEFKNMGGSTAWFDFGSCTNVGAISSLETGNVPGRRWRSGNGTCWSPSELTSLSISTISISSLATVVLDVLRHPEFVSARKASPRCISCAYTAFCGPKSRPHIPSWDPSHSLDHSTQR
jgi:hypothetical protein